ncbi:hypothetical protein, partial [Nocardiopsis trehalosi]|uniref:hypothetical protein n=1 Tax=Nocardiopsis trehalosi TaxID=109329 RepID=UPI000A85D0F8
DERSDEDAADGAEDHPDRGTPFTEWLSDHLLQAIAQRHPGLVVPDLTRTKSDFAHRPDGSSSFMGRDHRPLRRDYPTAVENTHRVRTAIQQASLKGDLAKLTHDGLPVDLKESIHLDVTNVAKDDEKVFRPDLITVRLFADVGRLEHSGTSDRRTGVYMSGTSQRGSSRGSGNTNTLALRFIAAFAGGPTDAGGSPSGGGYQQQANAGVSRRSATGQGLSTGAGTDAYLLFTGETDVWTSDVTFRATIDDTEQYHGADLLRDRGNDLADGIDARLEIATPRLSRRTPADVTPLTTGGGSGTPPTAPTGPAMLTSDQAQDVFFRRRPAPAVPATGKTLNQMLNDGGVFIAHVNNGGETPNQPSLIDLNRRMFFSEAVGKRLFGQEGYRRKYDHFTSENEGGRRFFETVLSQEYLAVHLFNGIVNRPEFDGGKRSPNAIRPTVVTDSVVDSITAVPIDLVMYFQGSVKNGLSGGRTRTWQGTVGGVFLPTGNINPADPGPDSTRGDAAKPTIVTGANAARNRIISSRSTTETRDYSLQTSFIHKSDTSYLITGSGTIRQTVEIDREWSAVITAYREPLYTGWQTRMDDLFAGFAHAWDAIANGLVLDTFTGADGTSGLTTLDVPESPEEVEVRPGLAEAGDTLRPADAAAALRDLEDKLKAHKVELTSDSRNQLHRTLESRLAKDPHSSVPIPVSIRPIVKRHDLAKPLPEPPSIHAVVHVEVGKRSDDAELDYLGGQTEYREARQWTVSTAKGTAHGGSNTKGIGGFGPITPNSSGTNPDADNNRSDTAAPVALTGVAVPHGTTVGSSDTSTASSTEADTRTIMLSVQTPFARLGTGSDLTLKLEVTGDGVSPRELPRSLRTDGVTATGDGGSVQTLYPAAYLAFGDDRPEPDSGGPRTPDVVTAKPEAPTTDHALDAWKNAADGTAGSTPDGLVLPVAIE